MKKIISLILALVMVMGLAVSASAASITINSNVSGGTTAGETYTVYKVFDATISNENVAYTIDGSSDFYSAIESYTYKDNRIFTLTEINDSGIYNVEVAKSFTEGTDEEKQAAAKDLANALKPSAVTPTASNNTGTFTDLDTGYYLITDTLGSALIVDTLGAVTINTKNAYPSLAKVIVKDGNDVTSVTADRGETITFKITVNIPDTVNDNIIIHDTMDPALTYVALDGTTGVDDNYSCSVENCAGTLHFEIDYDAVAKDADKNVSFTYTATLKADAAIAVEHKNVAQLTYSAFTSTATAAVTVSTYDFYVYKWTGDENNKTDLPGAGFKLKKGDAYYTNTNGAVTWTPNGTELTTEEDKNCTVNFAGIAAGTYTLVESTVPDGYNKANDITVIIAEDGTVSINNGEETTVVPADKTIEVENKTGSELPSTGGIGTTIFYVVGGLLMAGAVVLLITKKRLS